MEDGTVVLIGATTENPSFELNAALLSRCQVMVLRKARRNSPAGTGGARRREVGRPLPLQPEAREALLAMADGDGRYLLNLVEELFAIPEPDEPLDSAGLTTVVHRRAPVYDKGGEEHYNLISALHKSLRGSDTDAALYWLARMLAGGEDPHYIARRLLRFAVEDVGLAEPQAMVQALTAWQTFERLGSPEGELRRLPSWWFSAPPPNPTLPTRPTSAPVELRARPDRYTAKAHTERSHSDDEGFGLRERLCL